MTCASRSSRCSSWARALADGLRDHPMLPLVGSINQATDALKRLLDGLLDISKLDAGRHTPKVTGFSADTLIGRLGAEYAHRAERQGLQPADRGMLDAGSAAIRRCWSASCAT